MKHLSRYLAIGCLGYSLSAQALTPRELDQLPMIVADGLAVERLLAAHREEPRRFAVGVPLAHAFRLAPGDGLRLYSAGAKALAFHAEGLPVDARLQWQSVDGVIVHELAPHIDGAIWSPTVPGETGVLINPTDTAVDITLVTLHHSYRGLVQAKALGDSESCNIDVVCPLGDDWRDEIRSTVLLTIGNVGTCSGALVNNTLSDNRPLVLTANHCEIDASNVSTVNTVFNFQRSACAGADDGSEAQVVSGANAQFIASAVDADTILFQLGSAPPSGFEVHYAGWDARTSPVPQSGVSIHHPSGDQKKISAYDAPAMRVDDRCIAGVGAACDGGFIVDGWVVQWAQGTTEQGSSGSGLWNQDGAIVGVLSGGAASCQNLDGTDVYGRLERAWDTSEPLRLALDPANNGTVRQSCGRDPGDTACTNTVTPTPTPAPTPTATPAPTPTPPPATGGDGGGALSAGLLAWLLMLASVAAARGRTAAGSRR